MESNGLNRILDRIYADNKVSNIEFQALRDKADEKYSVLTKKYQGNNDISAFQKSADVTVQLMQNSFLDIKKSEKLKKLTEEDKATIREAFKYQIAYMVVCYDRFFDVL